VPQPAEAPKTNLSPNMFLLSGELNDANGDSVAEAARRSRRNAEPQPVQSR
jgi:hypothetical protein